MLAEIIQSSAGLAIERAGFVPRDVEFDPFLIDAFVAIDTVLFRIIPHDVVPPIE
jgi:hypothetical protein